MPEHKQESFTVTDRRLFNADGKPREHEAEPSPAPQAKNPEEPQVANAASDVPPMPEPPSADEQQAQADAYRKSSEHLDRHVEQSGHSAKELEMTFQRFLASLYMTAMMQLGLMHEEGGEPRLDIIGARQTIDTISLLSEKTKGNLSDPEASFLQNALYELRMAYVEVTNALARPPQPSVTKPTPSR